MNNYTRYTTNKDNRLSPFKFELELIEDYSNSNLSGYEIRRKYKIGTEKMNLILDKNNVKRRTKSAAITLAFKEGRKKPSRWNASGTKNIFGARFNQWEGNAKRRNIDYDISKEYLQLLYEKQNGKCAYTGIELLSPTTYKEYNLGVGSPYNISLDRIDSTKGYIYGNVQFVCVWVNSSKGNMPDDMFREVLKKVKGTQV